VFTDLRQAGAERRAFDVRSQMLTAATLTRRGASYQPALGEMPPQPPSDAHY
jgi:hypothetical protein